MDSGGAGKFRGGVGGEWCVVLHDAPTEEIGLVAFGYNLEAGLNLGICGGYPGSGLNYLVARGSDINERLEHGDLPKSIEELKGNLQELEINKPSVVRTGDAIYYRWSGGGGYGDPIDREPGLVQKDVANGFVSLESAKEIYGVVIDPETLEIDIKKTEQRRGEIRRDRLAAPKAMQ